MSRITDSTPEPKASKKEVKGIELYNVYYSFHDLLTMLENNRLHERNNIKK